MSLLSTGEDSINTAESVPQNGGPRKPRSSESPRKLGINVLKDGGRQAPFSDCGPREGGCATQALERWGLLPGGTARYLDLCLIRKERF